MVRISISFWELINIAKKSPETINALSQVDEQIKLQDLLENKGYHSFSHYVNSLDDLPVEIIEHCQFEVIKPLKLVTERGIKAETIASAIKANQIHLPGNELMSVSKVDVLVDCCTRELQEKMDEGWRIIAVLPQHSQRRPDYVLGKTYD